MTLTQEDCESICEKYRRGTSSPKLADEYQVTKRSILTILKDNGIERRDRRSSHRTKMLNHKAFDRPSPGVSYWTGFLMADGSINIVTENSAYVSLVLQKRDRYHLEKFRMFLSSDHAITDIKAQETCRFSVSSVELVTALGKYGVHPNKTLTAKVNGLYADRHFWRGVIDGDGSLIVSKGLPILSLVGSLPLVTQFETFVKSINCDTRATVHKHKSIYGFSITGKSAQQVIKFLYTKPYFSLDRKQQKAERIMGMHLRSPAHLLSGENSYKAKLTENQVRQIRSLYASGSYTQLELSKRFNVGRTCIRAIVMKRSWKNVDTI